MKHRAGVRSGLGMDWMGWKSRGGVLYGAPEGANKTIYIFKTVLTDICVYLGPNRYVCIWEEIVRDRNIWNKY